MLNLFSRFCWADRIIIHHFYFDISNRYFTTTENSTTSSYTHCDDQSSNAQLFRRIEWFMNPGLIYMFSINSKMFRLRNVNLKFWLAVVDVRLTINDFLEYNSWNPGLLDEWNLLNAVDWLIGWLDGRLDDWFNDWSINALIEWLLKELANWMKKKKRIRLEKRLIDR